MNDTANTRMIPLVEGARRLRQSYEKTLRDMLKGRIGGEKRDGRWLVSSDDVSRLQRQESEAT